MALLSARNIGLKLLSVSIAALLWLVVSGEHVAERVLRVPVELQNLPDDLEIVTNPPDTVEVRMRGSSGTLGRLGPGQVAAIIDLRTVRTGRRLFHLTPAIVSSPYGIETVQVSPATLTMEFDTTGLRIVRVNPAIEGRPARGYEVTSIRADPETVEVAGPEGALKQVREAITEPLDVTGRTDTVREVVTVGVTDPSVRIRTPQTTTVTVTIAAVRE